MQALVAQHPELLPVREFAAWEFDQPVCAARELRAGTGFLDLLLLSFHGCPILVEMKKFDNSEQYRDVVGQLLEYASDISKWDTRRLDEAIKAAAGHEKRLVAGVKSLDDCVKRLAERFAGEHGQSADDFAPSFYRKLERNLADGRFLLLIVGDGIRDSLVPISEMLNRPPHRVLGFSLGLVELGLYPTEPGKPWPAVVVPSVVEQVRASERVTIRVQFEGKRPEVSVVDAELEKPRRRGALENIDAFVRSVEDARGAQVADIARSFLRAVEEAGLQIELGETDAAIRHFDTEGRRHNLIALLPAGELWFRDSFLLWPLQRAFAAEEAQRVFRAASDALIADLRNGGITIRQLGKGFKVDAAVLDASKLTKAVEGIKKMAAEIDRAVESRAGGVP